MGVGIHYQTDLAMADDFHHIPIYELAMDFVDTFAHFLI